MEDYYSGKYCYYCGGRCPSEPPDSPYLCDGFARDIDGVYNDDPLSFPKGLVVGLILSGLLWTLIVLMYIWLYLKSRL